MRVLTVLLTLALQFIPLDVASAQTFVPPPSHHTDPGITGQVGDGPGNGLRWKRLDCPAGMAMAGVVINEGGWTASIQAICGPPSPSGGWSRAPGPLGETAGGKHGTHYASLVCPKDHWISGMGGLVATSGYYGGTIYRNFLANPIVYCSKQASTTISVSDPLFKEQKDQNANTGATYSPASSISCLGATVTMGMEAAVATERNPDIKAVILRCKPLTDLQ